MKIVHKVLDKNFINKYKVLLQSYVPQLKIKTRIKAQMKIKNTKLTGIK